MVLIQAERSALPTLGSKLAEIDGVAEAYSVTGEWDYVAILRLQDPERLAQLVTERLALLPGIAKTYTMVAFARVAALTAALVSLTTFLRSINAPR